MKSLPAGNFALSIAHPGHELRLHGFLEQAKPFVFILTDGSYSIGQDMMMESIKVVDTAIKQDKKLKVDLQDDSWKRTIMIVQQDKPADEKHIKDAQIYSELIAQRTGFFEYYINSIAVTLVKRNINFIVTDTSEQTNAVHEMCRIMTNIATDFIKKNTGKHIMQYEYYVDKPYNMGVTEDCIHIPLNHDAAERKLNAIIKYPLAIQDLKPNIPLDNNVILELKKIKGGQEEIKTILRHINHDFFYHEYLFPCADNLEDAGITLSEIYQVTPDHSETITYAQHLQPLKEKLEAIFEKI